MSLRMAVKSAVASGWKTIPATPFEVICCSVWSVTYAVERANSLSGAGPETLRRPMRVSRKPIRLKRASPAGLRRALELRLEPLEGGEALLERRVCREQREE